MSLQSRTSQFNENEGDMPQNEETFLPIITASPLMFEDDIISNGIQSHLDVSHTINRVISAEKSQLPSQWTLDLKTPSIEGTGCTISRAHHADTLFLSQSFVEHVSICGICDYAPNLNESNDHHNRTITDITEENSGDSLAYLVKRAKLNEPPGVGLDLGSVEAADVLVMFAESTVAINDQLASLQEDCGKHLTMAHQLIRAMDN